MTDHDLTTAKSADKIIFPDLTKREARVLSDRIRECFTSLHADLLEMKERNGWKALGYDSWVECAKKEFGIEQKRAYQLLQHARVQDNIQKGSNSTIVEKSSLENSTIVEFSRLVPDKESQSRVLAELEPEQQKPAFDEAVRQAGGQQPTAAQIAAVIHSSHYQGQVILFNQVPRVIHSINPDGSVNLSSRDDPTRMAERNIVDEAPPNVNKLAPPPAKPIPVSSKPAPEPTSDELDQAPFSRSELERRNTRAADRIRYLLQQARSNPLRADLMAILNELVAIDD